MSPALRLTLTTPQINEADRLQPMRMHLIGGADARRLVADFAFEAHQPVLPVATVGIALSRSLSAMPGSRSWLGSNSALPWRSVALLVEAIQSIVSLLSLAAWQARL